MAEYIERDGKTFPTFYKTPVAEGSYRQGWNDCLRAVHQQPAADVVERPRWIGVEERLPEDGTRALVTRFDYVTGTQFMDLLWFDKGTWWNRHFNGDYAVTHWQPLPEPPKEEAK